ncbi:hypothetical protein Bca101_026145 [Brassica carinata]
MAFGFYVVSKHQFVMQWYVHRVEKRKIIVITIAFVEAKLIVSQLSDKATRDVPFYEAPLGYSIDDVHPNDGIKKFKSSVYSNVTRSSSRSSLRLQGIWSPCSEQVAVGLKTHSCCMCDRALSPISLSTPTKSSSRLMGKVSSSLSPHMSESGSKAADPDWTLLEPTTKKPLRCNNLK